LKKVNIMQNLNIKEAVYELVNQFSKLVTWDDAIYNNPSFY